MTVNKTGSTDSAMRVTNGFNRFMYVALIFVAGYFLLAKGDVEMAMSDLGIALIFDPFKQEIPFNERPLYQRIWLLTHLAFVLTLLGVMLLS